MLFHKLRKNINQDHIFILVTLAVVSIFVAVAFYSAPAPPPDLFDEAVKYVIDKDLAQCKYESCVRLYSRILNSPLYVFASAGAYYIFGNIYTGMILHNLVYYFLLIFLVYKLALLIFKDKHIALLSAIIVLTNCNTFKLNSITYYNDLAGWFYMFLASYLALRYYSSRDEKFFSYAILASIAGIFYKETGALGMVTLGLVIVSMDMSWGRKAAKIAKAAGLFAVVPLIYYIGFFVAYGYWYMDWYNFAVERYGDISTGNIDRLKLFITNSVRLFHFGWILFVYGLMKLWQNRPRRELLMLGFILPVSLSFIIWPALLARILYAYIPLTALVAGYGLVKIKSPVVRWGLVAIYMAINYLIGPVNDLISQLLELT